MFDNFLHVCKDVTKTARKIPQGEYLTDGIYKIFDQGKLYVGGYCNTADGVATDYPYIIFGDHTRVIKYIEEPCYIGADGVKLLKVHNDDFIPKYVYYAMRANPVEHQGYSRHFKLLKETKIRKTEKTMQIAIINELDKINQAISLKESELNHLDDLVKSRFIEMFGDPEVNPHNWKKVVLSEIITTINNGMTRRGNDDDGNIVLRLVELQEGRIDYSGVNRIKLKETERTKFLLKENDFLFARVNGNPDYVGRCAVFNEKEEPIYHNDHIIRVHCKDDIFKGIFGSYLFNSDYGKSQIRQYISTSAGQFTINQTGISSVIVILPPIELQNEFAEFVKLTDKSKFVC